MKSDRLGVVFPARGAAGLAVTPLLVRIFGRRQAPAPGLRA